MLHERHVAALQAWPGYGGGGRDGVARFVGAVCDLLTVPLNQSAGWYKQSVWRCYAIEEFTELEVECVLTWQYVCDWLLDMLLQQQILTESFASCLSLVDPLSVPPYILQRLRA